VPAFAAGADAARRTADGAKRVADEARRRKEREEKKMRCHHPRRGEISCLLGSRAADLPRVPRALMALLMVRPAGRSTTLILASLLLAVGAFQAPAIKPVPLTRRRLAPALCVPWTNATRALIPAVATQPLTAPLPLFERRFVLREFLLGAKTMVDLHHLLVLGAAIARSLSLMAVLFVPAALEGLAGAIAFVRPAGWRFSSPFHGAEQMAKAVTFTALGALPLPGAALYLLADGLLSPLLEELVYRGGAQWLAFAALRRLPRSSDPARNAALGSRVLCAALFGLAHLSVLDATSRTRGATCGRRWARTRHTTSSCRSPSPSARGPSSSTPPTPSTCRACATWHSSPAAGSSRHARYCCCGASSRPSSPPRGTSRGECIGGASARSPRALRRGSSGRRKGRVFTVARPDEIGKSKCRTVNAR
jgi:hypothetical protein